MQKRNVVYSNSKQASCRAAAINCKARKAIAISQTERWHQREVVWCFAMFPKQPNVLRDLGARDEMLGGMVLEITA